MIPISHLTRQFEGSTLHRISGLLGKELTRGSAKGQFAAKAAVAHSESTTTMLHVRIAPRAYP
jgi:hypothetical protein